MTAAPSPAMLARTRPSSIVAPLAETSSALRTCRLRKPLSDGGPAVPGHWHALRDAEAGLVRRVMAHREGRYRWFWVSWTDVRVPSPRRRYFADLARAGHLDQPDEGPVVLTKSGTSLLAELDQRWA